jgi:hypothetical protein
MKINGTGILLFSFVILITNCYGIQGFYKDLFMDGGVKLTSRTTLPAADSLDFDWEFLATESETTQSSVMIESPDDENGALLYPDGAPRFRAFYSNGGSATIHGNSLGEEGRNRVRAFYYNGGSYTGSCAGAFLASISYLSSGTREAYYRIWPGRTASTGLSDTYTGHFIETGSSLLDYFDFGGDMYIDNIYHNGGCFAREDIDYPPETEVLLLYDYSGRTMHMKPSCWAYKGSAMTGRIVVIGSHPEGVYSGERLNLTEAIFLYAIEGIGAPTVKAELENGMPRTMDRYTSDSLPDFARIGDKQYHHFTVDLPMDVNEIRVILNGESGFDFNLYIDSTDFAFEGSADFSDLSSGADKVISIIEPDAGIWFISVECASTVTATPVSWGYEYSGNLAVLDGLSYMITATWDTTTVAVPEIDKPTDFVIEGNYPNPFNSSTRLVVEFDSSDETEIDILAADGRLVKNLYRGCPGANEMEFTWNADDNLGIDAPSGVYFFRIRSGNKQEIKRALLIR